MLFINRYCHIRNRSLIDQGKIIFTSTEGTLGNFSENSFHWMSLAYPKFYKMDRLSQLGFLASELLLRNSGISERYHSDKVAVILSNTSSSLDTDIRYAESVKSVASPALFVYTLPNIVAGEICIRHGLRGENAFFVFPEFDAQKMCDYVETVMATDCTQACVAGWVEVIGERHDVFLYLAERAKEPDGVEHTADQLHKIYNLNYGRVDA